MAEVDELDHKKMKPPERGRGVQRRRVRRAIAAERVQM